MVKKISTALLGINFLFSIVAAIVFKHYFTYANVAISALMIFSCRYLSESQETVNIANIIWNFVFFPYNIVALWMYYFHKFNVFTHVTSFFLQYVLFVILFYFVNLVRQKKTK